MTDFSGITHAGCKHELNEDTIGWNDEHSVWLVADGMGGHAAGEVASDIAKTEVLENVATGQVLIDAVMNAHAAVVDAANAQEDQTGMGTTIAAARVEGCEAEVVWVGDSRVYLWRNGSLSSVTTDHSFVQMLIDSQKLSPQEARDHPERNVVTQVLGVGTPEPGRITLGLHSGDCLLLCSDGLNDELTDAEIATCLRQSADAEAAAAAQLIEAACANGGRDNVSAIVVHYDGPGASANEVTAQSSVVPTPPAARPQQAWWSSIAHKPIICGGLCALLIFFTILLLKRVG